MKDGWQVEAAASEGRAVAAERGRAGRTLGAVAVGFAVGAVVTLVAGSVIVLVRGRGGSVHDDIVTGGAIALFLGAVPAAVVIRSRPRTGPAAVPVGIVAGVLVLRALAGTAVDTVWAAPADRGAGVEAVGSWLSGGVVVRARADEVVAYRVTTGTVAWRWAPPGRAVVCAMSAEVGGGAGLLGYADSGRPCDSVVAVDLSSGRVRWTTRLRASGGGDVTEDDLSGLAPGSVAIAGGTAVLAEDDGWQAVALADARALWRVRLAPGCAPLRVAGDRASVVAVDDCGPSRATIRELRASDGRQVFRAALPVRDGLDDVAVLSCDPATVWVDESGARGTNAVLAYAPGGRLTARVPLTEPRFDLALPLGTTDQLDPVFTARPAYGAVVTGGLLIAPATEPGDITITAGDHGPQRESTGRLVAYSLTDGAHLWTAGVDDEVDGITVQGGSVWAVTTSTLFRFDAVTGHRTASPETHGVRQILPGDLWRSGDLTILVNEDGTEDIDSGTAPVRVLR